MYRNCCEEIRDATSSYVLPIGRLRYPSSGNPLTLCCLINVCVQSRVITVCVLSQKTVVYPNKQKKYQTYRYRGNRGNIKKNDATCLPEPGDLIFQWQKAGQTRTSVDSYKLSQRTF